MKSPVKTWTDAKWRSWVISLLRRGTLRFPNRNEVLKEAKTDKKINAASGRMAQHYRCAECLGDFPASKVAVDHIQPVVCPQQGFQNWDTYIERMFCTKENLQVLCEVCHTKKSFKEKEERKLH